MIRIKKESGWTYQTSAGGEGSVGLGVAAFAAGRGVIVLNDPYGADYRFQYSFLAAGAGLGVETGPLSKGSAGVSKEDYYSKGKLYILDGFQGNELRPEDIEGNTLILEASAAMMTGAAVYALLLGIKADVRRPEDTLVSLAIQLGVPSRFREVAEVEADFVGFKPGGGTAKAILFMGGQSAGFGFGASAVGGMGAVWLNEKPSLALTDFLKNTEHETTSIPGTSSVSYNTIPISLPDDVLFDTDKFIIKPAGEKALTDAGAVINLYPNRRILITGYTDSTGSRSHNQRLSENRAKAVKQWLVARGIVKDSNVRVTGYGEDYAVASNRTTTGREKNRRVEILIMSD